MAKITTHTPVPPDEPDVPDDVPPVEPDEEREPPAEASSLGSVSVDGEEPAPTWHEGYRSALDNPRHPLHHLKDA